MQFLKEIIKKNHVNINNNICRTLNVAANVLTFHNVITLRKTSLLFEERRLGNCHRSSLIDHDRKDAVLIRYSFIFDRWHTCAYTRRTRGRTPVSFPRPLCDFIRIRTLDTSSSRGRAADFTSAPDILPRRSARNCRISLADRHGRTRESEPNPANRPIDKTYRQTSVFDSRISLAITSATIPIIWWPFKNT